METIPDPWGRGPPRPWWSLGRRFLLGLATSSLLGDLGRSPFLQQPPGRLDLRQATLTTSQLVGGFVAPTVGAVLDVFGLVGGHSLGQELGDLLLHPRLLGLHPVIAHGLVPRGVGLDLGAIEGDGADLGQAGQGTELEDLDEEGFEPGQVDLAEVADGAEVGGVLADDGAAGDVGLAPPHDPPRGPGAGGVAVQEQGDHHPGVERRLAAELAFVMGEDGREVERGDGIGEEVDEVALGEPVLRRGREEIALVGRPIAIGLGHATLEAGRRRLRKGRGDYSKVAG